MRVMEKKLNMLKKECAVFLTAVLCCFVMTSGFVVYADASMPQNRFNVEIVLDASNSMNYTDPDGLRYEAIGQFINLLANEGNYLGGVVFSNKVEAQQALSKANSVDDKNAVMQTLKSVMSTAVTAEMGYTNIGDGLEKAMADLEKNGSADLPSVIVFLSDGNTEMPTEDEQEASLNAKADAIERARELGVKVYSICLNANGKADISEMDQISKSTGGISQEVKNAEDLVDVFNAFYALIYGSSSVELKEGEFPESGEVETQFNVPGVGVEEVNIVANGQIDEVHVFDPQGSEVDADTIQSTGYTMVKLKDPVYGTWSMVTRGKPGTKIKINMVYNTNLGIRAVTEPESMLYVGETLHVSAVLLSGDEEVAEPERYDGYQAEAVITDAYGDTLDTVAMPLGNEGFEYEYVPDEGVYFVKVTISGNYLEKTSEAMGPITVMPEPAPEPVHESGSESAPAPVEKPKPPVNTPPEPVEEVVERTVNIWPIYGGHFEIDFNGLAKDEQDSELRYTIDSSSYMEGTDYKYENGTLKMDNFSLSKGTFDIKATDTGGLSCHITLKIQTINIGLIALIGIGVIALIVLAVFLILLRIALTKPFRGKLTVQSNVKGQIKGRTVQPRRGRCKLSLFSLDQTGLNYTKSYIQASGSNYVTLVTDKPVTVDGRTSNSVKVQSGVQTTVRVRQDTTDFIQIRFESRMKEGGRSSSNRGRGSRSRPSGSAQRGGNVRSGTPRRTGGGSRGKR